MSSLRHVSMGQRSVYSNGRRRWELWGLVDLLSGGRRSRPRFRHHEEMGMSMSFSTSVVPGSGGAVQQWHVTAAVMLNGTVAACPTWLKMIWHRNLRLASSNIWFSFRVGVLCRLAQTTLAAVRDSGIRSLQNCPQRRPVARNESCQSLWHVQWWPRCSS